MLETPLFGRFQREDTRLVFGPPAIYTSLVRSCIIAGGAMLLYGLATGAAGVPTPLYPAWWLYIGAMVCAAGGIAALSLQSISFDLRERTYTRRQGPGAFPKVTRGQISRLDALVCISEPNSRMVANGVTYHLVLYWKGQSEPLMVLQTDTRQLPPGQPLNVGAAPLLAQGARYANALGVPYHDNTHFASKCPVPIWS